MINLLKVDWDLIEKMINEMLSKRIRTWEFYNYFIINNDTILVKAYDTDNKLMFTIKAKLAGDKLEVVEVS